MAKRDLFDELMEEVRRIVPARGESPLPLPEVAADSAAPAEAVAAPPIPRLSRARARPHNDEDTTHHAVRLAVIAGILVIIGAGCLAVMYITNSIRKDNVKLLLRQVESDKGDVEQLLLNADSLRDAKKEYAAANAKYESAVASANALLAKLHEGASDIGSGALAVAVRNMEDGLQGLIRRATEAMEMPEIKHGVKQGWVQFDDGTWGSPEEKQKRFEDLMKSQGRTLTTTGEWLTKEEIMERQGLVKYIHPDGTEQWVTKEVYAQLTAPKIAYTPPTTTLPKPRPTNNNPQFDPAATKWVLDDFESENSTWRSVPWRAEEANPCTVAVGKKDGSFMLAVNTQGGTQPKCAITRSLGSTDFTSRSKLTFDLYNDTGRAFNVSIALTNGNALTYYESRQVPLKVEKNQVTVDLQAGDFKADATKWTHATTVKGLENVRNIYILFYIDQPGKVYLDNITVLGKGK